MPSTQCRPADIFRLQVTFHADTYLQGNVHEGTIEPQQIIVAPPTSRPECQGCTAGKVAEDPIKIIRQLGATKFLRSQADSQKAMEAFNKLNLGNSSDDEEEKDSAKVGVKSSALYQAKVRLDVVDMLLERVENHKLDAQSDSVEIARTLIPDAATQRNLSEMFSMMISTTLISTVMGNLDITSQMVVAPLLALGFNHRDTLSKSCRILWQIFLIAGWLVKYKKHQMGRQTSKLIEHATR